jgi:hypothetical protein
LIQVNLKLNVNNKKPRHGIVLVLTLLVLVVLSVISYTLTSKVLAQRHRYQYLIDYQSARYACDAGTKYAILNLSGLSPKLIERADIPDFSDLFALTDEEHQLLLDELAYQRMLKKVQSSQKKTGALNTNFNSDDPFYSNFLDMPDNNLPSGFFDTNEISAPNLSSMMESYKSKSQDNFIPGPYGQKWPLVAKPINFEIGSSKIRVEIEDENAKYPLGWALLTEENVQLESLAGFITFCEWMNIYEQDILTLQDDLDQIAQIKSFKLNYKPITKKQQVSEEKKVKRGNRTITVPKTSMKKVNIPTSVHTKAFANMFNSSLVSADILTRPTLLSEKRKESALKYMGLWGSNTVNVNTAPRHVLEAAFTFGGNAALIAEEIIQLRKVKPIKDIEELRKKLLQYSDSIEKCKPYLSTTSNFFTIRIIATRGNATVTNVIGIKKDGTKVQKIAVMSG